MKLRRDSIFKVSVWLMVLRSPVILLTMLFYFVSDRRVFFYFFTRFLPLVFLLLALVWYSTINDNDLKNVISQVRDITLSLLVLLLFRSVSNKTKTESIGFHAIYLAVVIISYLKLVLVLYSVFSGVSLFSLVQSISEVWGLDMMTMGTDISAIARVQIPFDCISPFFSYFIVMDLLLSKKVGKWKVISFLVFVFSVILTFSRMIWVQTVLFMLIGFMCESTFKVKVKFGLFVTVVVTSILLFTPVGDVVFTIISSRFGDSASMSNDSSDLARTMQNHMIFNKILESPLFGHGIGYFIPGLIRSTDKPYLYESQSLALIMQIGVAGVVSLIGYIVMFFFRAHKSFNMFIGGCLFLSFWIISGSLNPYLFGASGGVILYLATCFSGLRINIISRANASAA